MNVRFYLRLTEYARVVGGSLPWIREGARGFRGRKGSTASLAARTAESVDVHCWFAQVIVVQVTLTNRQRRQFDERKVLSSSYRVCSRGVRLLPLDKGRCPRFPRAEGFDYLVSSTHSGKRGCALLKRMSNSRRSPQETSRQCCTVICTTQLS